MLRVSCIASFVLRFGVVSIWHKQLAANILLYSHDNEAPPRCIFGSISVGRKSKL